MANLLWHLPTGMVDRRQVSRVADLVEGEIATVLLKVKRAVVFCVSCFSRFSRASVPWFELTIYTYIPWLISTAFPFAATPFVMPPPPYTTLLSQPTYLQWKLPYSLAPVSPPPKR